ncbi:MAG: hypothetical protein U5M23_06380 [Marinagarivorans sp.]|nr:hypothetical protein [Marinagarivorans sp.]
MFIFSLLLSACPAASLKKLKPFISIIVGAVLVAVTGGALSPFVVNFWGAVLLGGITGAVGAAANGGNLRDVLKGAAFGAVSGAAFLVLALRLERAAHLKASRVQLKPWRKLAFMVLWVA